VSISVIRGLSNSIRVYSCSFAVKGVCASNPETWLSLRDKTRNDIVEFVVRADPEPIRGVTAHTRQGAILQPDTDSPETGCELFQCKDGCAGFSCQS